MRMRFQTRYLLFLLLGASLAYSQERGAASVAREDSEAMLATHEAYLDSARTVHKSDLSRSIDYITQSIAVLGDQGYDRQVAASLTLLGEVYRFHGQIDLAVSNLEDAYEMHASVPTSLELAEAYLANSNFAAAESLLLPLKEREAMVPYRQVQVYELLGDSFRGQNRTEEALAHYRQALAIADQNQIAPKVTDLNSKIGETYAGADRLQEARAYFDNSLELSSKQAPARAVLEKERVADFYNSTKQYEEEIALRKKSLNELKEKAVPEKEAAESAGEEGEPSPQRIAYKIANAYIAQDQYDQAIPYLRESIREAGAGKDLQVQKDATRTLSEVYREKGDYTRALESYQDYVTLVDSLYRQKEEELAQIARFNREIAEKQSRITGLEQERALSRSRYELALSEQELIRERNKRQQWVIYSLVFAVLLMALTAYFFYRSNRQQKLANNLLALKSLRSQMNPHFIFNALNSVNHYISRKDERSANRFLGDFSRLMRSVMEHSEKDFIPLVKELELLNLYLRLEHSRFPDAFDYEITLDENLVPGDYHIPPMLLQPFIENAIWHGLRYKEGKGWLRVSLKETGPGSLEVKICDNGIGRRRSAELKTDHQRNIPSRGMENVSRRIAILNEMHKGRISVEVADLEADGTGTNVTVTIQNNP